MAREFENWRKTKVAGRHIPLELWQQVKKLPAHYRISQITQMLRINTEQYRRYVCPDLHTIARKATLTPSNDFIKVENPLLINGASTKLRLEFIRKDGATLNCYYSNTELLHETVRWFMGL